MKSNTRPKRFARNSVEGQIIMSTRRAFNEVLAQYSQGHLLTSEVVAAILSLESKKAEALRAYALRMKFARIS